MATQTQYYNLDKPNYNEVADIEIINANMDKIDQQMRNNADGVDFAKGISSDAYDNSKSYAVGDYCVYDNKLYRCITAIESAEAFNIAKWEQTTVGNEVKQLNSNLNNHNSDTTVHITSGERTNWNSAKTHADSVHARTDATNVAKSSTNGNVLINGSETNVYTHPSGTNPHGTTKSDVGLGNVGNFKAVSTVASQGLSATEQANARANIGAGTSSFSGSYNDLSNKPSSLPASDVYAWAKASSKPSYSYSEISGTPTIPTKFSQLTNDMDFISHIVNYMQIGNASGINGYIDMYYNNVRTRVTGNDTITSGALTVRFPSKGGTLAITSSDVRLKDNVKDTTVNGLETINKIKVRQFDWNNNEENGNDRNTHQDIGFIADELEELDSRLAVGGGENEDGEMNIKGVDMFYMLGYVVKAIQELSQENELLKDKIKTLES